MFSKLKQLKDLRSQAKSMQSALEHEKIEMEKNGIKIAMNGNMEIIEFKISENMDKETISRITKDLVNEAIKKTQRLMAKKMQEMGGFPSMG